MTSPIDDHVEFAFDLIVPTSNRALLDEDNTLPGADVIELSQSAGRSQRIMGRIIARDLPCSRTMTTGHRGCGAEDSMMLIRHPVRGLNLPGEHIVGLLEHCTECGHHMPLLVNATPSEIAQGWAPGTVM